MFGAFCIAADFWGSTLWNRSVFSISSSTQVKMYTRFCRVYYRVATMSSCIHVHPYISRKPIVIRGSAQSDKTFYISSHTTLKKSHWATSLWQPVGHKKKIITLLSKLINAADIKLYYPKLWALFKFYIRADTDLPSHYIH